MQLEPAAPTLAIAEPAEPMLAMSLYAALTVAPTRGARVFPRCPPVHSILLGDCRLSIDGQARTARNVALPASTPHDVVALNGPYAGAVYLDPRRYRFEDAQRLAERWRGFVPGRDDLREALGDALRVERRRVDARLLRALDALEGEELSVSEAAGRARLSESRFTHLITETFGAPPRTWRAWFKLRRAIGERLFGNVNLTEAAHRAGFADSAHLTRTCKQLTGVRPAQMMPRTVYVCTER